MTSSDDLGSKSDMAVGHPDDDRRRGRRGVERLRERGDVLAALDRILKGEHRHASRSLLVEGNPGFGKTAVLNSGRERAEQHGWSVAMVECRPADMRTPFATAAGLFGSRLEHELERDDADPDTVRRRLTEMLDATPAAGVLLIVDDARLADEASWEWFLDLAAQPPSVPFAMMLSSDPRLPGSPASAVDTLAAHPATQVFQIRGLSEASIADLFREQLGALGADPRLPGVVAAATHGSPFLVHRVASSLAGWQGSVDDAVEGDVWRLPSSAVASWMLARVRDLPTDSLALLRAVAILGDGADVRSVEVVASAFGGVADISQLADQLAERDVLARSWTLGFVYPLVRLSIYDEVSPMMRSTAHLLAAQQMRLRQRPESEVAVHLLHTEPDDDETTVDALIEAAQRQLDMDDNVHLAARFLDRAIVEPPSQRQLPAVQALRAEVVARCGGGDPVRILRDALSLGSDVAAVFRSGIAVIDQQWEHSSSGEVIRLLASVAESDELLPFDRLDLELAQAVFEGTPAAGARLQEMLRSVGAVDDRGAVHDDELVRLAKISSRVLLAAAGGRGSLDELLTSVHVAFPFERMVRSRMMSHVFQQLVAVLAGAGEVDAATALLDAADDVDGMLVDVRAWNSILRADIDIARGRLVQAERELFGVVSTPSLEGTLAAVTATTKLSMLMELRGNPPYSYGVADAPLRLLGSRSHVWQQLRSIEAEADLHAVHRDWKAARARFRVARELAATAQITNPALTTWRSGMSGALVASDDRTLARRHAEDELVAATTFGGALPLARALRALAAASDDAKERIALLEEARLTLEDRPLMMEQCRVLFDLGCAYREVGHDDDARDALREAADTAVRMGAGTLMSSAHQELVAAGARPRRLALSGASALTPAERRVAAMAAAGRKNTEIASDLYVSIKTVESHLARVYRKLDVDGRVQLTEQWSELVERGDAH